MNIQGLNKTTLLDYPGNVAATIFMGGCNFRCPYCHNKDLVVNPVTSPAYTIEEILSFLTKRKGILSGVCISGGEPTLQPFLSDFIAQIKALNYLVKLDTNGSHPEIIRELLSKNLIDYIAMDIKTDLLHYPQITQQDKIDSKLIEESVSILKNCNIDYEFRTTVVKELHNIENFTNISLWLKGAMAYYLQSYKESDNVITPGFSSYSVKELNHFLTIVKPNIPNSYLRGVE